MAHPQRLSLKLTDEDKEKLIQRLTDIVEEESANRSGFVQKIRDWTRQYESVHTGESSFPWPKSANPKTGVTQYNVDTLFSVFVNAMRMHRNPWIFESDDPEIKPAIPDLEKFMQSLAESASELNYHARTEPAKLDSCKHGSGVVKVVWDVKTQIARTFRNVPSDKLRENFEKSKKTGRRVTPDDILRDVDVSRETLEIEEREITTQGPRVYHISLLDWWYPIGHPFIQDMPWVAERYRILSDVELDEAAEDWLERARRQEDKGPLVEPDP